MKEVKEVENKQIRTGEFSSWLYHTREVLKTDEGVSVPCGECRACCTSSYFIHILPRENKTLASIPGELLFPAPWFPGGTKVLGFDENGHCPMLINNTCSIYENRPQTCHKYDCRVLAAAGLSEDDERILISQQADCWEFIFSEEEDYKNFSAVQTAAKFIRHYAECFPTDFVPAHAPQQAILAIKVYDVFLDFTGEFENIEAVIEAVIDAYKRFETEC
ncbi:MAG: YkgJ family cysteine cluster protein [bacterium]|nr:YkgJ family cysteine cluster protein [bacterium]